MLDVNLKFCLFPRKIVPEKIFLRVLCLNIFGQNRAIVVGRMCNILWLSDPSFPASINFRFQIVSCFCFFLGFFYIIYLFVCLLICTMMELLMNCQSGDMFGDICRYDGFTL